MEVRLHIGPVATSSARAWLGFARRILDSLASGAAAGVEVADDLAASFRSYLDRWDAEAASGDIFDWDEMVERDELAQLSTAWLEMMTKLSGRFRELGLEEGPPEGESFYHELVDALGRALSDDSEPLGEKLREAWPALGGITHREAGAPVRVVIADDAGDLRMVFRIALEHDGRFQVVGEARDGQEAIDVCERERPDVLLLDVVMPGVDGWTALQRIRSTCPGVRVVVVSTLDEAVAADRALACGAAAYVQKSVSLAGLSDTIAALAS